jgi:hypothetical protein
MVPPAQTYVPQRSGRAGAAPELRARPARRLHARVRLLPRAVLNALQTGLSQEVRHYIIEVYDAACQLEPCRLHRPCEAGTRGHEKAHRSLSAFILMKHYPLQPVIEGFLRAEDDDLPLLVGRHLILSS